MVQAAKKKIFDDRYEILSIVGRGARSVVYHARHVKDPSTEVALKVLLDQKGKVSNPERLRKEALALVSSRHRYVIRLDDFHSVGSLCYLSLEFAPEADLRRYAQKLGGKLPADLAERFLLQIAEGLSFVHKAGIIHRDVKPDNILVISEKEVRLGDFGVAVLPGESASLEDLQSGVGTMNYLAPEVLDGKPADQRSDLYAVGVCFYELLTGRNPFEKATLAQQIEARRDENIPRIGTLAPETPEYLATTIMQAMSFDAEARFATVRDFIQALLVNKASMLGMSTAGSTGKSSAQEKTSSRSSVLGEGVTRGAAGRGAAAQETARRDAAQEATETTVVQPAAEEKPTSDVTATRHSTISTMDEGEDKTQSMPKYAPPPAPVTQASEEVGKTVVVSPVTQTVIARAIDAATSPSVDDTVQVKKSDIPVGSDPTQTTFISHKTIDEIKKGEELRKSQGLGKRTKAVAKAADRKLALPPETSNQPIAPARMNLKKLALLGAGAGLALMLFIGGISRMFSGDSTETQVASSEFSSPLPPVVGDEYLFPQLPSGLYVGSASGILPGKKVPLTLISLSERKEITVILGIEGWQPVTTKVKELAPKKDGAGSLRTLGNGYIIDLTAQTVYGELYGTFRNLGTGTQGEWRARPVRPKQPAGQSAPQNAGGQPDGAARPAESAPATK